MGARADGDEGQRRRGGEPVRPAGHGQVRRPEEGGVREAGCVRPVDRNLTIGILQHRGFRRNFGKS